MKKIITLIALVCTFALSAQNAPVDTIVKQLNESEQIAEVISSDTITGFSRYVKVTNIFWNLSQNEFKTYFQVYNYSGTQPIYSYRIVNTLSNTKKVYPDGTQASPTDSISTPAGNVSKIDSIGATGEYNFLFNTVSSGQIDIIPLIRAKIAELDNQNKFYK